MNALDKIRRIASNVRTLALVPLAAALLLAGCDKKDTKGATPSSGSNELRLYIWSEYIDPQIVKDFEAKENCKVVINLYESNEEMIAKLQAGGMSQYDLVVPSGFVIPSMIQLGLLQKLDHTALPNLKNLKPLFQKTAFDSGNVYSSAWQWGTVGLMVNKKFYPEFKPSWASIFKPTGKRPYILIDSEREMIGAALKYLGKSLNTVNKADLEAASKVLLDAKKNPGFLGFEGGVGGKNKVAGGSAAMALVYNGDAVKAMGDNKDLAFVNPVEGGVMWVDNLCIPAKAPNAALAHKFIDYILDAKVGAQLSNFNQYATPNEAAMEFIKAEDRANPAIYPDSATMAHLEPVVDLGKESRIYSELWKIVKSR
jgi:spermidine/putrescine transport system substrate-binding protein